MYKVSDIFYINKTEFLGYQSLSQSEYYCRKEVPTDIDNLQASLIMPNGQYQILSPVILGTIGDVEYLVNGNTRQYIASMISDEFLPIPVQRIIGELKPHDLTQLQFLFNDTTRSHNAIDKYFSIAEFVKAYNLEHTRTKKGADRSAAALQFGVTHQTVSQAIALANSPKSIQNQLRSGFLNVDAAIKLIQTIDALLLPKADADVDGYLQELYQLAANMKRGLTVGVVTNWRKNRENSQPRIDPSAVDFVEKERNNVMTVDATVTSNSTGVSAEQIENILTDLEPPPAPSAPSIDIANRNQGVKVLAGFLSRLASELDDVSTEALYADLNQLVSKHWGGDSTGLLAKQDLVQFLNQ